MRRDTDVGGDEERAGGHDEKCLSRLKRRDAREVEQKNGARYQYAREACENRERGASCAVPEKATKKVLVQVVQKGPNCRPDGCVEVPHSRKSLRLLYSAPALASRA